MSTSRSEDLQHAIYDGVTLTTLGEIFGLDHKEVKKRIVGRVKSHGGVKNPIYRIRDAAPYLCEIKTDPEEMIKSLSPSKLPSALQDAFWKAQISRQKYEENRGDLWRTQRVFEVISSAFKTIRLTVLMFVDTVSQRTEMSLEQRRIIQELGDGLLESLVTKLREEFALYDPPEDEHGMPLGEQELKAVQQQEEEVDPFA